MCWNSGAPFFDMNAFKADSIEKKAHNKLIFILLKFILNFYKAHGVCFFFSLQAFEYRFRLQLKIYLGPNEKESYRNVWKKKRQNEIELVQNELY